jgi:hypothetical protein
LAQHLREFTRGVVANEGVSKIEENRTNSHVVVSIFLIVGRPAYRGGQRRSQHNAKAPASGRSPKQLTAGYLLEVRIFSARRLGRPAYGQASTPSSAVWSRVVGKDLPKWPGCSVSGHGGECTWWAHLEFTRINITPIILRKKIEDQPEFSDAGVLCRKPAIWFQLPDGRDANAFRSIRSHSGTAIYVATSCRS